MNADQQIQKVTTYTRDEITLVSLIRHGLRCPSLSESNIISYLSELAVNVVILIEKSDKLHNTENVKICMR